MKALMMVDMQTQDEIQPGHEQVSALMDGCLTGAEFEIAMQSTASDEVRQCWHLYHLIGDTLRSPELAACQHDARFVQQLSERLKLEPVHPTRIQPVVAAAPISPGYNPGKSAANDGVFRWKLVAGLASFAAVAAFGWGLLGSVGTQSAGPQLVLNAVPASGAARVESRAMAALPAAAEAEAPVMLRDPRLDEFLAAHRQASGVSALGDASGFLRNATFEGSGR